jgi:hypothetical protein
MRASGVKHPVSESSRGMVLQGTNPPGFARARVGGRESLGLGRRRLESPGRVPVAREACLGNPVPGRVSGSRSRAGTGGIKHLAAKSALAPGKLSMGAPSSVLAPGKLSVGSRHPHLRACPETHFVAHFFGGESRWAACLAANRSRECSRVASAVGRGLRRGGVAGGHTRGHPRRGGLPLRSPVGLGLVAKIIIRQGQAMAANAQSECPYVPPLLEVLAFSQMLAAVAPAMAASSRCEHSYRDSPAIWTQRRVWEGRELPK